MNTTQKPVVHLITTLDRGGAEKQLLVLVKQQILREIEVSVLFLKGSGELTQDFKDLGAQVIRVSELDSFVLQILRFRQFLRRMNRPHIVHAHLPQAELVSTLSLSSDSRLINSRHFGGQFYPAANKTISRLLGKFATLRTYKVIAISRSVKEILIAQNEVKRNVEIEVVHYGFDQKAFRKHRSSNARRLDNISRIGTVARLSPEKDLGTLIKSFRRVKTQRAEVRLEIVGAGSLLSELTALAAELGLSDSVSFLGKTADVEEFMSSLDLFVLTSKFEGFGMVLLEAMCSGCKIVAARNSAIPEVLGDEGAGLMFETGNDRELANKILESLDQQDGAFRSLQIERLKMFSSEGMCKRVLQTYGFCT